MAVLCLEVKPDQQVTCSSGWLIDLIGLQHPTMAYTNYCTNVTL